MKNIRGRRFVWLNHYRTHNIKLLRRDEYMICSNVDMLSKFQLFRNLAGRMSVFDVIIIAISLLYHALHRYLAAPVFYIVFQCLRLSIVPSRFIFNCFGDS